MPHQCLILLAVLIQLLIPFSFQVSESINITKNHDIIVTLDPYISILDKRNQFRYNANQLLEMITVVSTEFSRFHIQLADEDLIDFGDFRQTGLFQLPSAVATYNSIRSSSGNTTNAPLLELWLSVSDLSISDATYPLLLTNKLTSIADKANSIFNQTVTTLLIPFRTFFTTEYENFITASGSPFITPERFRWGVITEASYCNPKNLRMLEELKPDIVLISVPNINHSIADDYQDLSQILNHRLAKCQVNSTKGIRMGILTNCPDTDIYGRINMSRSVSGWRNMRDWARTRKTTVIMNSAIDTPYSDNVQGKTSGWWRYIEGGSNCANFSNCLEAKSEIYKQVDVQENTINFTYLKNQTYFKSDHVGVVFSLFDEKRATPYTKAELNPILPLLSKHFSKATILFDRHDKERIKSVLQELKTLSSLKGQIEVTALLMPEVELRYFFTGSIEAASKLYGVAQDLVSTFVVPFVENDTKSVADHVKNVVLRNRNVTSYKFGYAFPILICNTYWVLEPDEQEIVGQVMDDAQVVYFYFEEDRSSVKLGASRLFTQKTVMFDHCRKFVRNLTKPDRENVEVAFVMVHYSTRSESFYREPLSIYNFVRYWDMLSAWVEREKTTVILSSLLDSTRSVSAKSPPSRPEQEVGWWRYHQPQQKHNSRTNLINSGSSEAHWIDKKSDALALALSSFQKPEVNKPSETTPTPSFTKNTMLDTIQIILIAVIPLLLCVLVSAFTLWLMRRHYRQNYLLSRREMEEFFRGVVGLGNAEDGEEGEEVAQKMPYDRSRYEVPTSAFSIEEDNALGCGEFGKVVKGKLERSRGKSMNVAVKTVNMQRFRKATLSGLLSEIKVLAYVEGHQNIVELVGAYTSELKHGKIYVFLELCHLGSLEKHLRGLRPEIGEGGDEMEEMESDRNIEYVNLVGMGRNRTNVLDPSVCQDLFRWSADIARGMAYLARKKVVHADLATRNVLLNMNRQVKICDFGLSRRIYNYTEYVKQQQEPLPWRWMPPESLRLLQFNEKSDVWAYGVTLWEMYSLGDQPYPGLSWDGNFPEMLERGLRLSEPKYNYKNMYSVMKQCWATKPDRRPHFVELLERFSDYTSIP